MRPALAEVYASLTAEVEQLSGQLQGGGSGEARAVVPQLNLQHFSQVTFGRLDLAWQQALAAAGADGQAGEPVQEG